MYEVLQQVLSYLRSMWRYRWYAILLSGLIMLVGWYKVYQMPDLYSVSSSVQINTASVLRPLLRGLAIEPDLSERMHLITRTLLSRPNIAKLAKMSDLDLRAKNPEQFENLVERLKNNIKLISSRTNKNLYTILYSNKDPKLAKKIVQNLLNILVESTLGASRENSDTAQKFLQQQLREYEKLLRLSEDRLKDFKREKAAYMPTIGRGYFDSLQNVRQQKREAELLLNEANKRRDELKRQIVGEEPVFGFSSTGNGLRAPSPNDAKISALQEELDTYLLQFTELHPKVITLKASIKKLKQEREKDLAENPQVVARQPALETNPVYQQLKISLAEAEAQVAALNARFKEYTKRENELKKMVDTLPQVEADLNRLTRDYEINRQNYDEIRKRSETAKLSEEVEEAGDGVKIKVIEPPRLPREPSGPNRTLFNSVVFLFGLASGLGLTFLMAQLRPVIYDQHTLRKITGLPVFGEISNVMTDKFIRKKKLEYLGFVSSLLGLLVVYAGIMYVEKFGL